MALTKCRLGELIQPSDERNLDNKYNLDNIKGISTGKEFIETKANMDGVSLSSYKVVRPWDFAYVADTSRRGEKIALAYNKTQHTILISSIYTVFCIARKDLLLSDYLFMYFNRPEFDRYARFNSWGSARETFDWDTMCDIEIELPDLPTQQRYVDIYNALVANQQSYERGLDDLKLVCDGYIEDLRRQMPCEKIGPYIVEENNRNTDLQIENVQGVNSSSSFGETRADTNGIDFRNYKIVKDNQFAYNPSRINLGSISLYKNNIACIISPMYCVFSVRDEKELLPEYLMLWFGRKEFQRSTLFYAMGSVRDTFDFSLMKEVEIPIPDITIQQSIVDIYHVYMTRKSINEKLKAQIKNICPILIRGSLEEARVTK